MYVRDASTALDCIQELCCYICLQSDRLEVTLVAKQHKSLKTSEKEVLLSKQREFCWNLR